MVIRGGIREPKLNASVRNPAGTIITIGDHVWDDEQAVGEYNGPTHELSQARESDNSQRLRLEDQGWWLIEIYNTDVTTERGQRDLIRRLRTALGRHAA